MNCQLKQVTSTARDGRISSLEQVFIRGSQIRYVIAPDMLKHAPMFKRIASKGRGLGVGRGRAQVTRGRGRAGMAPGGMPRVPGMPF